MHAPPSFSDAEWARRLAAEQARRELAEAELAAVRARLAALEQAADAAAPGTGPQAFYEQVLAQLPTAVAVYDSQHRYVFVNPAAEPDPELRAWMLGKTSGEAGTRRGRTPAMLRQRAEAFARAQQGQQEVSWVETHEHAAGTQHLLLRYRPLPGPDRTTWIIGLGQDMTEPHRAEERRQEQQQFYESILGLLPVDVTVFDAAQRFVFINPAAMPDPVARRQALGQTNHEYFARHQPQHAGLAEQREQYFDLAVRTRTDVTWEEMGTDRLGRPQLMVRHLRPVYNHDGSLRVVVGSGIDITPRYTAENLQRQVQERLQEQQDFIRLIVDSLPNVVYLVEADHSISFSNRVFQERIRHADHLDPAPGTVAAHEVRLMREFNEQVMRSGQPAVREMPLTLRNGSRQVYEVHKRPLKRPDGQVGVLTISTDVTAVKQARQTLERREKQYYDLVFYSQAMICTFDLRGTLLSVNPAIERLLGWPAHELVGQPLDAVLPPEHQALLHEYLDTAEPQQLQDYLMTVRTRAGERRYLRSFAYLVREDGFAPYVVASGYDVTAGVLAQRALEQAKREAEENAHAKESFLARMSHEIRTPLNGVLGMASLLRKTPLTPEQAGYLRSMQHAGQQLLVLLNDVLDMAKITGRHLRLNPAPFDLTALLQESAQAVEALALSRGLRLVVEVPAPALPPLVGDVFRLRQVLLNLLGNALKFTERGEVRLGAAARASGPAETRLRLWVQDTGIGIAPHEQAHIFEAFAQANTATSVHFGGTGLGLAISQQLVGLMGSALHLESEPGRGSTFSFELALPHAHEAPVATPGPAEPPVAWPGLRGLRVLLAEDNPVSQWLARVILENQGVRVSPVANGLAALALLREQDFDAAILDIRMPGLNGVDITTAIRADADLGRASLPIIALTANAFEADRQAYLAAGMNACLVKPYDEADLCQLLLDLTGQSPPPG